MAKEVLFLQEYYQQFYVFWPAVKGERHRYLYLFVGQSYLSLLSQQEVQPVRDWELPCQKYSYTNRLLSGQVEMYVVRSNASYKSPSSSSLALIPL